VPMKAAALQFVLAHPAIPTNIPGTRTKVHLDENFKLIEHPIPTELWAELRKRGLIRENAPAPS
ncbi:MAG: aldo/keto reductase, partial [Hyphomicrobiales bacterium]|nr:aldo/keto reductase [Hyphomicrobiales bacterium]